MLGKTYMNRKKADKTKSHRIRLQKAATLVNQVLEGGFGFLNSCDRPGRNRLISLSVLCGELVEDVSNGTRTLIPYSNITTNRNESVIQEARWIPYLVGLFGCFRSFLRSFSMQQT